MSNNNTPNAGNGRRSKVARILETYEMEEMGEELEKAWKGEKDERKSLRELAEEFNKRIIEMRLREAGQDPLPGEIDTIYRAVKTEDVSSGLQREVRGRLERYGIQVESLESELVSYQAIRTYLTNVRGAKYTQEKHDTIESSISKIHRLKGRLRAVTEKQLDTMSQKENISIGNSRVLVQVQVYCENCGRQYDVEELLNRGGCDCNSKV